MRILFFIFSFIITSNSFGFENDDLRGNTWEFKNTKDEKWLPAKYLDVHLDLIENGVIEHPYYANNEKKVQWVENESWEYRTILMTNDSLLNQKHVELAFLGLDTYCEIYMNDSLILFAENMFREWRVDIKEFLEKGENELRLVFLSPIEFNKEKVLNAPYKLPAANEGEDIPIKVSPYTRKAAYQFGWDWGPRIVTFSAWRPIELNAWDNVNLMKPIVFTKNLYSDSAEMVLEYQLNCNPFELYQIEFMGENYNHHDHIKGVNNCQINFSINKPELWYPIGYGNPHLYRETLLVKNRKGEEVAREEVVFAVRGVELIQEKDDKGTSFYFKINDQPVFAKGANYIPQSLFLNEVEDSDYDSLIQDAVDLNMNMLRVWGGGIYEREKFYELCDEKGIMVWQDFMFSNSMYPNDTVFIANMAYEIIDNVKRLSKHPSVIMYCGNNEIDVALKNWGWEKTYNWSELDQTEIEAHYQFLFQEFIPELLEYTDNTVPYVSTSPLSNWGKAENFNHSSMHYWGVWHGGDPFEGYKTNVGRFMAEYGFQSFPKYEYLLNYIPEEEMNFDSETIKNRQKSYVGNGLIDENVKAFIKKDLSFLFWIDYSQYVQAHAYQIAISQHRIQTPHCMGTLFWQLNDCWPGPSWSIRNYSGEFKEAAEVVRKYYQPIIGVLEEIGNELQLTLVSNNPKKQQVDLKVVGINESEEFLLVEENGLELEFLSPTEFMIKIPKKLQKRCFSKKKYKYYLEIKKGDEVVFKDHYFPTEKTTIPELAAF